MAASWRRLLAEEHQVCGVSSPLATSRQLTSPAQASLRRSERSGGWRARLTIPVENEEKKEVQRILELKEEDNSRSEARRRPSLLAVRRRSSAASSRRTRLNSDNSHCSEVSLSELSIGGTRRRKKEKRKKTGSKSVSPPVAKKPAIGLKWNIANIDAPIRTSKERQEGREQVTTRPHVTPVPSWPSTCGPSAPTTGRCRASRASSGNGREIGTVGWRH